MERSKIWEDIRSKKRFVIKIGTNSLLDKSGDFDLVSIATLIRGIKSLMKEGKEVLLVSSGAVSAGMKRLKIKERPREIVAQQAFAAIGNPMLMQQYIQMFGDTPIAQILLTQYDLSARSNYMHLREAFEQLLAMGIVPIINENDVVSIDELAGTYDNPSSTEYNFSDNDVLSALTTGALNADVLIILSDVDGLYSKHPNSPKAVFIDLVEKIDDSIKKMGTSGSKGGRGGMVTKLLAAEIATKSGAYTIITHAKQASIEELLTGNKKCTIFMPNRVLTNKNLWLMYATNSDGRIIIDEGATKALVSGASLLLPGISSIEGKFKENDIIQILDPKNKVLAKGISNYSSKVIQERLTQKVNGTLPKMSFGPIVSHENMIFFD